MKIYIVFKYDYEIGYEIHDGKAFLNEDNANAFGDKTFGHVFEYEVKDIEDEK